ncbi:MAG TPA: glutathione S-transferase family protein [Kofleriaceae bacterium]|nr:glutathione S-transferase family protein [Kofleriaceae bacterium]
MYELYIANKNYSSWSLRPWLLMRQLDIPFHERFMQFPDKSAADPGAGAETGHPFRAFSPTGRVPCLHDGETVVWDSLAIVEYLAEQHADVWPADARARAWARCAAAEMHAGFATLRERCSMSCGIRVRLDEIPPALAADLARLTELWREGLARFGGPFLAGAAFTAVDAFYGPVALRIQTYSLVLDEVAAAYAQRLLALPAMRAWYEGALAETFRDPSHEGVVGGMVVEDLRAS